LTFPQEDAQPAPFGISGEVKCCDNWLAQVYPKMSIKTVSVYMNLAGGGSGGDDDGDRICKPIKIALPFHFTYVATFCIKPVTLATLS